MGFALNQFVLIGGSEELPLGDNDDLRMSRAKTILTKAVQTIIACNQGWELDTSKNATDTDYMDIPTNYPGQTVRFPGLFLKNAISDCKLFISDFPGSYSLFGCKNFNGHSLLKYEYDTNHLGICMSIISGESESEFGNDPYSEDFFPDDATRICGTYYRTGSNYTEKNIIGSNPKDDWSYMYGFGVTPYVITIFANHNESGFAGPYDYYIPIYACGRIFGELAHKEDNLPQSKYGVVLFRRATDGYESWVGSFSCSENGFGESSFNVPCCANNNPSCGSIAKADGEWVLGGYNQVVMFTFNSIIMSSKIYQNGTAWSAIAMGRISDSLDEDGIVPGDGFKGLLDTDLFRAGRGTDQQRFSGGKFFMPESSGGLLLGVDSIIK